MKTTLFIVTLGLVAISAAPIEFEVAEDDAGDEFLLVPLNRQRRETDSTANKGPTTKWDVTIPDLKGIVKHEGTILQNDNYHLTGSAYAGKDLTNLRGLKPDVFGGDVKLTHMSGLEGGLGADRFRGGPTNVRAEVNYPLYQDKNFKFDVGADYSRQFGGPFGTGRPDAGVFIRGGGTW